MRMVVSIVNAFAGINQCIGGSLSHTVTVSVRRIPGIKDSTWILLPQKCHGKDVGGDFKDGLSIGWIAGSICGLLSHCKRKEAGGW
jgi:hypothetical protein